MFLVAFAEYILMKPSEEYAVFMAAVTEKIYMSKVSTSIVFFGLSNLMHISESVALVFRPDNFQNTLF